MTFKLFLRERKKPPVATRFDPNTVQSYLVRYKSNKMDYTAQTLVWSDSQEKAEQAAREIASTYDAKLILCETTVNFVYNQETRQYIRKPMTRTI